VFDESKKSVLDIQSIEQRLSLIGIREEGLRDDVTNCRRVTDATQVLAQLLRHGLAFAAESAGKIDQFEGRVGDPGQVVDTGWLGNNCRDTERARLLPAKNFHSLQSREHEMRSAVGVGDAGSDETDGRHRVDRIRVTIRVDTGNGMADTEHSFSLQSVRKHIPIALLEYEERHVAVGEKRGTPQDHYWQGVRDFGWFFSLHSPQVYEMDRCSSPRFLLKN